MSEAKNLFIPCEKIAGAWPAPDFSYTYSPTCYSLIPNTKSYIKM